MFHCSVVVLIGFPFDLLLTLLKYGYIHVFNIGYQYQKLFPNTELRELSPASVSLKKLYQETISTEPVLILISPGADPSQELQDMAGETVGLDKYHQVSD